MLFELKSRDSKAPGRCEHVDRLHSLLRRWRAEAAVLGETLAELQGEHDHAAREATWLRLRGEEPGSPLLRHVALLQRECDDVAIELMHVQLAVQGAEIELAQLRGPAEPERQQMPA